MHTGNRRLKTEAQIQPTRIYFFYMSKHVGIENQALCCNQRIDAIMLSNTCGNIYDVR